MEYVEPNYQRFPATINTNDTHKDSLWGLENIGQVVNGATDINDADMDVPESWLINEGTNSSIIVAVIDNGVGYNHPDLLENMWDGTDCKDHNGDFLGGCEHGYSYYGDINFGGNSKFPLPTRYTCCWYYWRYKK